MFEIGFSEILVIALLVLLVLGPKKLPKVVAQLGRWTGRARAMTRNLRMQLEQEVSYEELMREKEKAEAALRAVTSTQINPMPPSASSPPPTTPTAAAPPAHDTQAGVQSNEPSNGSSSPAP